MIFSTERIERIAIFRALQLGDLLCAIPAIRALRAQFPLAHIALIGLPWAESLVKRFPQYFDYFIHFPGYPGFPEQPVDPEAFTTFLGGVQAAKFDLAIQIQGNGTLINPVIELFGATYTAGFCVTGDYCPDEKLFLQYPTGIHEIERHLALMKHLGIPSRGTQLEFPLTSADEAAFRALELPVKSKKYVCVHPGSRGAWRQWPPACFAALADYCIDQGLAVVLTGTETERPIVDDVVKHMKKVPVIAAGKTSLGAIGVLIRNAYALIANCTGVSHMAAAFQTPGIVISMDGEPERWAPLNKSLHFTINWLKEPDFEQVFEETKKLLSRYRP